MEQLPEEDSMMEELIMMENQDLNPGQPMFTIENDVRNSGRWSVYDNATESGTIMLQKDSMLLDGVQGTQMSIIAP